MVYLHKHQIRFSKEMMALLRTIEQDTRSKKNTALGARKIDGGQNTRWPMAFSRAHRQVLRREQEPFMAPTWPLS